MASGQKERVLLVHNFYQIGGGEHTVYEQEKQLLETHGHTVITYTRDNAELNRSGLKKLLLPFTTVFSLKTYREVKKIIRQEKIDLVHCHNTFPLISPSVYYAARKCKVPVIQTVHNFRFLCANGVLSRDGKPCEDCLTKGLKCAVKHQCYRNSKLQTLVLINMLRIHRRLGTYRKIRYIFLTGFNREKFRPLLGEWLDRQFTKPNFEQFEIGEILPAEKRENAYAVIGRLEPDKGTDFLLEAWKDEKDRELYIFGNGILQNEAEEAGKNNPRIHPMGFRPKGEILEVLKKSKAMIFPTNLYEGFPMTILESFATGTPVICSDLGNGADIVRKHNAGVPYTPRDKEALQKAILEVEANFPKYSEAARKAYEENYTPEINYRQLKSIYEEVRNEEVRNEQ